MCERLAELHEALVAYTRGFDGALLSVEEASEVLSHAVAMAHCASTLKALAASRAFGGSKAPQGSDGRAQRSSRAARELSRRTGGSLSEAAEALELAGRLSSQPEISEAARSGELSPAQAAVISEAVSADPSSEAGLLQRARSGASLSELREACREIKAAACPDLEARWRSIRAGRRLRCWVDQDGIWHISGLGTPEDGAEVDAALYGLREAIFEQARRSASREDPQAYAFDALVELARQHNSAQGGTGQGQSDPQADRGQEPPASAPSSSMKDAGGPAGEEGLGSGVPGRRGAQVKLLLRVDLDAFLRGAAGEGETCELAGYGPVPVSVVERLLASGNPLVALILTKGRQVSGVAHLSRRPSAHQMSALEWLYPSCAAEGCTARAHLEVDHREDWARTRFTAFDLLDRLCRFHHRLKTTEGWALVEGCGKRPFVPPGDPRHPRRGAADGAGVPSEASPSRARAGPRGP